MSFDQALKHTLGIEGGYSNDKRDSGGETAFGITKAVAIANGYSGPMDQMPVSVARAIYRSQYWDLLRLDPISAISPDVAHELFDTGVNCGLVVAGRQLQRALNALNREQQDYPDVTVDGLLGPRSVHALGEYIRKRGRAGERVLLAAMNALQGTYYIDLAERRSKDEDFVYGWLLNRVLA